MTNKEKKEASAMVDDFNRRITRGIAFLDKKFGRKKWLTRIDESRLNVGDGNVCITGQVYVSQWNGFLDEQVKLMTGKTREKLEKTDDIDKLLKAENRAYKQASTLGFYLVDADYKNKFYNYDNLTRLWFGRLSELKLKEGIPLTTPPPFAS